MQWKDGSTSWVPLKDLKESNPIEVAEFAIAHRIEHEPAFAWWASHVMKTRECVISAMKSRSRYWDRHQKFGIPLPKSHAEALQMDKENRNDLWARAMAKKLLNVDIAFDWKEVGERPPPGNQKIPYQFVFDVKMDFTRKTRLVAGGHVTDVPSVMTYSSVVSRDSVQIMFMIAALNDLDIMAGDIGNAYLNAETTEKVYMIAGSEFGEQAGSGIVICQALYGLKSSNVFCDNDSVVVNCTKPDSTIKRKHNAIAYHKVREAVVVGIIRVAWEASNTNLADLLTKPLAAPALQRLCAYIFH